MKYLRLVEENLVGTAGISDVDISKIVVSVRGSGLTGEMLSRILREKYHLEIAALSCHGNPVHPDKDKAAEYHRVYVNTCKLAQKLGVETVVTFSGCPGDCPESKRPNWVTCAWPADYSEILEWQWNEVLIPYWKEAAAIALHFVNYKAQAETTPDIDYGSIIEQATGIIEQELQVTVDRDSFNYYRFVTHMHYMMKRTLDDAMIDTQNRDIFESMKKEYPSIYSCSVKVAALIEQQLKKSLSEEEILYLILHINRLCAREDCDR